MKNNSWYLLLLIFILTSCHKHDDPLPDPNITFEATLSGASEVPQNWSTASGTATATYNTSSKILSVTITYLGFTPTYGHIHKADAGQNGDIIFHFPALASPIYYSCPPLGPAQEMDLLNNHYYINLHSAAYPDGEIRGQLMKQ